MKGGHGANIDKKLLPIRKKNIQQSVICNGSAMKLFYILLIFSATDSNFSFD